MPMRYAACGFATAESRFSAPGAGRAGMRVFDACSTIRQVFLFHTASSTQHTDPTRCPAACRRQELSVWFPVGKGRSECIMTDPTANLPALAVHGSTRLPSVEVDSYNLETRDNGSFLGDRITKGAFSDLIENWRKPLRKKGEDPFGDEPSEQLGKRMLDDLLSDGDPKAAGVVQSAVEDFAQELAFVIRRHLRLKAWHGTERIVIGGGFRARRIGEVIIGRAGVILKAEETKIDLLPIRNDPDKAGLIGAAHLVPSWMFKGYDAI